MELLAAAENGPIGLWVSRSEWGYTIVLAAHTVGMALVVGLLFVLSARVLGLSRGTPISAFEPLMTVAWLGFAVNAASGALLFLGNAQRLIVNPAFLIKLGLIALGGLVAWGLWRAIDSDLSGSWDLAAVPTPADGATAPAMLIGDFSGATRLIAVLTILVWSGAILAGRLIGYTIETGL